jgi:hypothetical protein
LTSTSTPASRRRFSGSGSGTTPEPKLDGGLPPLDFETVAAEAMNAVYDDVEFPIAGLRSIVGFKRLAGRPRDRNDLIGLEEIHGELPNDAIPGLDT